MIHLLKKIYTKDLRFATYRMKSIAGHALPGFRGTEGNRKICEFLDLLPELKPKAAIR